MTFPLQKSEEKDLSGCKNRGQYMKDTELSKELLSKD